MPEKLGPEPLKDKTILRERIRLLKVQIANLDEHNCGLQERHLADVEQVHAQMRQSCSKPFLLGEKWEVDQSNSWHPNTIAVSGTFLS